RKASCCALLKRCTSSTKRMVRRPAWRARVAASTASRMSFTPEVTADRVINSASAWAATSRARVVLPVPGGPHCTMECGLPARMAARSGLSGPSKCAWPTYSSRLRGRMRSASGCTSVLQRRRDHVYPGRRREHEALRVDGDVALQLAQLQAGALPQPGVDVDDVRHPALEPKQGRLESPVLPPREQQQAAVGRRLDGAILL